MQHELKEDSLSLHFNVLVERQPDGGFVAHCLELDLVAEATSSDQAFHDLLNIMDVQIRTCVENDNLENLFFPAPKEVWEKLLKVRQQTPHCRFERVEHPFAKRISVFEKMEVDQFCYA